MPIYVTCDECSEAHRVKDDAVGKKFKCKGCGKSLIVNAPATQEEDFSNFGDINLLDEEKQAATYAPKKPRNRTKSKQASIKAKSGTTKSIPVRKTKVPLGIDLVYFGFLAYVLIMFLMLVLPLTFRPTLGNAGIFLSMIWWLSLASVATTVVTTFGKLLCLTAPQQMEGKASILVAVAIDMLPWLITTASWITVVPPLLRAVVRLLSVAGLVCFLLFLGHLGEYLGERDLRERANGIFRLGIGCVALSLLQWGLTAYTANIANDMPLDLAGKSIGVALLGITQLVVMVIVVFRYFGLLSSCRYTLSNC